MQRSIKENQIGFSTKQGLRYKQEDKCDYTDESITGFQHFPRSVQRAVILDTFETLQQEHCQNTFVGSTACMAMGWISQKDQTKLLHLVTANLGDSHSHLLIVNSETGAVHKHELLTKVQKPTDPAEKLRISKSNGYVIKDRLNGDLAMSRAFGDTRHDGKGLSHVPEVEFKEVSLALNESAYIITVSDGLDVLAESDYTEIVARLNCMLGSPLVHPAVIAEELVTRSIDKKSNDNCTAIAFIADKSPISISVFDGHGGVEIAESLSKYFYATLTKKIQIAFAAQIVDAPIISLSRRHSF